MSFKVLQVLLVSCETAKKDSLPLSKNEDIQESRISTIPLRSEKMPRFIIRRARPHLVTYNIVKTPLPTLGESSLVRNSFKQSKHLSLPTLLYIGFDNRNDNGAIIITDAAVRANPLNATTATEENGKPKVAKVDSKMQAKSDIIEYGLPNDDRFQYQQQPAQHQYKSQSLYDYNTMHSSPTPYFTEERDQSHKYSEAPKLEYLHAYQFADDQQEPSINGQEFADEQEYPKSQFQVQQPQQEQVSEIEISKSKQYSYSLRKPEQQFPFQSSFHQSTATQLQQPQPQALYQPQQSQPHQQQQQQHFSLPGRETAYLKETPVTVVPQYQEEFKFQRFNRPPVEKEVNNFDDDTKPVHIHHHYPVHHTEESDQPENQQIQQIPQFNAGHASPATQPPRSQFYPSVHSNSVKSQFAPNQFPVTNEPEPTQKPYPQNYHTSYIPARKPTKSWLQPTPSYEVTTTKAPPPKWENPYHGTESQPKPQAHEDERNHPQVVYPNNIRIEIPEEEIYKHIQNSVHQIIRDLKEKRTKEHVRGKPLVNQDQFKFLTQTEEGKREKSQPRIAYNKSSVAFDQFSTKPAERNPFELGSSNNAAVVEKPRDQGFHQLHHQHQHQQPQHFHHSQRINSRHHEEEKPFVSSNKFNPFRFEGYSAPVSNTGRATDATQYENGYPRETISTTVDITMKNPKKAPQIDLNALDVGQTWNHDSHFESQEFKNDHTQAFFNSHNHPSSSSPASAASSQSPSQFHSNFTNSPFGSPNQQSLFDQQRPSPPRVQSNNNFHNNDNGMAYVSSAINVKDPFPQRTPTPSPAFFKASPPAPEPEVPEVDIMHGMLPVVNQFDNGHRVMKVILDPSKMPRELVSDVNPGVFQPEYSSLPNNVQTIQYNMNHQHLSAPILQSTNNNNNQYIGKQHQQQINGFPNHIADQQQNYISYPKERKTKAMSGWANNIPEGSANVIQYLPPPPLPASRSLLPYDSYSPIYNEDLSLGKSLSATIMRNKRHRGSEEYKKIIRTYPRNSKKVKTVKILEPSTEMKPPPKFNKFSKKSSA